MSTFQKLALGGGGVKGVLHIGALQELAKHQPLVFPQGVYGSSIGAVIGTYVAFGLPVNDQMVHLTKKYLAISKILPETSIQDMAKVFSNKGLFDMSVFESSLTQMFLEAGLDIRKKVIGDANMPLYIITSNITKGVPTILSKNVPVLDALKCSCCLPGLFRPQELYGQLYLDGGLFTPCISVHAPDALCITLKKPSRTSMSIKNLPKVSPLTYIHELYDMSMNYIHDIQKTENTLSLKYPKLHTESDLEDFDIEHILEYSRKSMRDFLGSKGRF